MDKSIPDRKYISIRAFLEPISKDFSPEFRTEYMVSFTEKCLVLLD